MSTKLRVVLGLSGIIVSLVMTATYLGLIPDRVAAVRSGRTVLAESIAVHSTAMVMKKEFKQLAGDFELMAERNNDLISVGLRQESGNAVSATPGHEDNWLAMDGEYSKESQVRVPIWNGNKKWGELELYFQQLDEPGLAGLLHNPFIRLLLFMGGGCFIVFYFYLGKVLSLLDPSKAVPGRVRTALDTMAEGLLILDRKEQIVLANQAFAKLIDKPPEKLLGQVVSAFPWQDAGGNTIAKQQRPWVIAIKTGQVQKDQVLHLVLPSKKRLILKTNCSPVLGSGKKYAGVLISFDDITPLEEKKIELEKSRKEAESANQAKSEFLANMSHEIRTPMNAILGFTEILKRGYVKNEEQSLRYLNIINSSGKNLLDLINDILDLSKVESGREEIEIKITRPHPVIADILQILDIQAREKSLSLRFTPLGPQPEMIQTDPVRLRQIMLNLVGNAVKFTDYGSVTIDCRLENDPYHPRLIIRVTDSGIGISADKLDFIFDPFVQANTDTSRRHGGTGLGLAISRKFAKALGGDISVESEPGKGSCFTLTLPTGDLAGNPLLDPETILIDQSNSIDERNQNYCFPQASILVVDDGPENRQLVRFLLEDVGLDVDEAENGVRCLEKLSEKRYDLILMDIQMPEMDGFTATRKLREQGVTAPIIALTANAMKGFDQQCLNAGYSGYLSKPIEIDSFISYMADQLGAALVEADTTNQPIQEKSGNDTNLHVHSDTTPLVSSLPTDNIKIRELVVRFIDRLDTQLVAMEAALTGNDMADVAALAHWLKGAGGTVGFNAFTEPAAELERYAKEGQQQKTLQALDMVKAIAARIVNPESDTQVSAAVDATEKYVAADNSASEDQSAEAEHLTPHAPVISRLAEDTRFYHILLLFTEKLKKRIEILEDGWRRRDMEQIADFSHWLKGAAGTLGYDEFTEPATLLEKYAREKKSNKVAPVIAQILEIAAAVQPPESTKN